MARSTSQKWDTNATLNSNQPTDTVAVPSTWCLLRHVYHPRRANSVKRHRSSTQKDTSCHENITPHSPHPTNRQQPRMQTCAVNPTDQSRQTHQSFISKSIFASCSTSHAPLYSPPRAVTPHTRNHTMSTTTYPLKSHLNNPLLSRTPLRTPIRYSRQLPISPKQIPTNPRFLNSVYRKTTKPPYPPPRQHPTTHQSQRTRAKNPALSRLSFLTSPSPSPPLPPPLSPSLSSLFYPDLHHP